MGPKRKQLRPNDEVTLDYLSRHMNQVAYWLTVLQSQQDKDGQVLLEDCKSMTAAIQESLNKLIEKE